MYIRCWGSRGSIPVCGKEYIKYGGDTTCMEVRSAAGDIVVIDAGTGIRCLGHKLAQEGPQKITMLFTHAHLDHLLGFPFFAPLFMPRQAITVLGDPHGMSSYRSIIDGLMTDPYFPVHLGGADIKARLAFRTIRPGRTFRVGGLKIRPISLSHPNNGGLGFRFEENGKVFVFLTDNELSYRHTGGLPFKDYVAFCRGADLLIHDAEYTSSDYNPSWGHSLYTDAVELALEAEVNRLGLFHLNNKRTDQQVETMASEARKIILQKTRRLECRAIGSGFKTTM
ncbi:MAG: MBL fold metallo-hydrolase [Chitinivibrionales bacterium]|nr:MBL fold metallo-hydrolase [Chitinivibrionales bacterium]MBD3358869.1 MBL fold metallo-hydrolase [Chitinivibrionales bacterium]